MSCPVWRRKLQQLICSYGKLAAFLITIRSSVVTEIRMQTEVLLNTPELWSSTVLTAVTNPASILRHFMWCSDKLTEWLFLNHRP